MVRKAPGRSEPRREMSANANARSKASRAPLGALKSVLPYALAYPGRIIAALVALMIASAAALVVPVAVRRMIDFGFSDSNAAFIRVYFLGMLFVVAVLALASGARSYLVVTLGERVVADLRANLFAHLTRLDPGFFDAEKTGEIAMMVVTSLKLSAFVLAAIPIIVLPLFAAGRAVRQHSRRAQDTLAEAT